MGQNDQRNLQHDALAAPLSIVLATALGRNSVHIAKLALLSWKSIVMPLVVTFELLAFEVLKPKPNYRQSEKTIGDLRGACELCQWNYCKINDIKGSYRYNEICARSAALLCHPADLSKFRVKSKHQQEGVNHECCSLRYLEKRCSRKSNLG